MGVENHKPVEQEDILKGLEACFSVFTILKLKLLEYLSVTLGVATY